MISEQNPDPFVPPCRIEGLAEDVYRSYPAANYSSLQTMLERSPAHVRGMERKETAAMSLGTIAHAMILEPETVAARFAVPPDGLRMTTNAGKAQMVGWLADTLETAPPPSDEKAEGKRLDEQLAALRSIADDRGLTIVPAGDYAAAATMANHVMGHPNIGHLIEGAAREVSFFAAHTRSGTRVKARMDLVNERIGVPAVLDLKTSNNGSWSEFARSIGKYQYHLQAALYRWVYYSVTGRWPAWCWIVVENEPPYEVAWFEPDQKTLAAGESRMEAALSLWAECESTGVWPGYPADIQSISISTWAL